MTLINIKGVSSLGKAAYVLTVFPYVLLTVLLVRFKLYIFRVFPEKLDYFVFKRGGLLLLFFMM